MRIILINTKRSMKTPALPSLRLTPIAFGALLLSAGSAMAQTAAQAETQPPVATVVVSASADASAQGLPKAYAGGQVARGGRLGLLGNVDIMDTPFNTMNYTSALIQDQQARSVADVVQNDPSVRVARGFGNYQELYVIRGFAVNSDDMAWNGLYGLLPRQFVAAELLERVEVFRGANSFINGAAPGGGGVGGMVNLLPKRAPNAPLNRVTMGVESGGQGYVALDAARRFGQEQRAGIRVNAVRRDGATAVDREKRELSALSVGLDYRGSNYRLSADLGYQDHKLTAPRPSVTIGTDAAKNPLAVPSAPDADSNFAQPWTNSSERDTFGSVRGEIDLAPNLVAWGAFGARSSHEFNSLASPTTTDNIGNASAYRFDNARDDTIRTGEIGIRGTLRTGAVGHTLSATVSGWQIKSRNAYGMSASWNGNLYRPVDVAAPAFTFTGNDLDAPALTQKSLLSSFAVADTLSFLDDRVLVTVGARRQNIRDVGYNYLSSFTPNHDENSRYDSSATTPVAAIVYKPVKNLSLYANYIEALQKGAVAMSNGTIKYANEGTVLAPYTSRQKEIGAKYDGGKFGASTALFTTTQPVAYAVDNVFGTNGEQRNQGLELSVFGLPAKGLRLLGGLTLLEAEQRRTQSGKYDGNNAIGVPHTQLNVGAEWDVPQVQGLSLNARTVYTSSQYADAANTQKLPSWTRLDIGANYVMRVAERDVTFRARIDNVTDRSYWASAGGYPDYGYLVLGAPRTLSVSASVDF
jgi:iron complex outermembrane receptor protein